MNPTLIIARLTFREAVRRKIVLTAILLGVGFLIVYSIGFHLLSNQINQVSPESMTASVPSKIAAVGLRPSASKRATCSKKSLMSG